ncbi:hypothetical protein QYQ98_06370 [Corynebacterium sp. P3-F1]|uniref:hypothetical protein n=1 Tax=Corynebacterium sp. P3-F1 TaxID=3059080 RepID=UPI00265C9261|nr:hypothetical protein [Corynebacterium sp. P3-F1]WKK60680.1 hypothetical protein QYQ98_06370 [Corynebacterium sp. P3-F1]
MPKFKARTAIAALGAIGAAAISPAIAAAATNAPSTAVLTSEQAQAVESENYGFWSEVGGGAARVPPPVRRAAALPVPLITSPMATKANEVSLLFNV